MRSFVCVTGFWLKYFDHHLTDQPGAIDAASGVLVLGRRNDAPLRNGELIAQCRGAVPL